MAESAKAEKKREFHVPHVYTIIFILMVVLAVLTWIVPSGAFDRAEVNGREVTVAGTYKPVEKNFIDEEGNEVVLQQGLFDVLMAPAVGVQEAVEVVGFILIVGGSFQVITATEAISNGMGRLVQKFKEKSILLIPICMLAFALGGSTFGMAEETLPFFAILLPIIMSMGFDSLTAFMIVFLGARIGYMASTVNPFNVIVAQGICGITGNPQLWLRGVAFVVMVGVTVIFVMRHAMKVKANPEASATYESDKKLRNELPDAEQLGEFTTGQKLVLVIFALGMGLIVYGLVLKGWYMNEISGVFVAMAVLSGLVCGFSETRIATEFVNGLKDFAFSAIVVGLARGILVIATDGMIIDTILNSMVNFLSGMPAAVFTSILYALEAFLTILVPSSSGLAALTMPIFGPLTELVGLNPEAAVMALCMGGVLTSLVCPTCAMLVAGLGVCKIDISQWWKTCMPLVGILAVLGLVFCAISGMLPVA